MPALIPSDTFTLATTPEQAVDRLAELYQQAASALSLALKRYVKERIVPDEAQRALFRYPELRITYLRGGEGIFFLIPITESRIQILTCNKK